MPRGRRRLDPPAGLAEALAAGLTRSELAEFHGVARSTVTRWAQALGLAPGKRGRPSTVAASVVEAIRRGLLEGASPTVLAKRHKVSRRTVRALGEDPSRRPDAVPLPPEFEIPDGVELTAEERQAHDRTIELYRLASAMLARVDVA